MGTISDEVVVGAMIPQQMQLRNWGIIRINPTRILKQQVRWEAKYKIGVGNRDGEETQKRVKRERCKDLRVTRSVTQHVDSSISPKICPGSWAQTDFSTLATTPASSFLNIRFSTSMHARVIRADIDNWEEGNRERWKWHCKNGITGTNGIWHKAI